MALWRVLGIGLLNRSSLGRDERLLLLDLLVLLGLHGNGLGSDARLGVKQESAVLAARQEAMQGPGKGGDEEKPGGGIRGQLRNIQK